MGRRIFRNYYNEHMDKTKGEGESNGGRGIMGERRGRIVKEHVKKTHGQTKGE